MQAIKPNWNAPQQIQAFTTLRHGGVSLRLYDSFNLGDHVGMIKRREDQPHFIGGEIPLPQMPLFLKQTHSTRVLTLPYDGEDINADAVPTQPTKSSVFGDDCRLSARVIH